MKTNGSVWRRGWDSDYCRLLKTSNLREFPFRTIREIRTKARVETRIEHAKARPLKSSGDHHQQSTGCSGPGLYNYLDVAPEQYEKPDKSIEREPTKPASSQSRDFRLVDFKQRGGGRLRQSAPLDDCPNLPGQLGLGQRFRRLRVPQVRKNVAAANDVSLLCHPPHSSPSLMASANLRRRLISSISACGVAIPRFDFF